MKRIALAGFVALLTLAAARPAPAAVSVGDRPAINWKTTDGRAVTNADLRGRMIVVDFWATWCGPCMAVADQMVALAKDYKDEGVNLVGVSLDQRVADMEKV